MSKFSFILPIKFIPQILSFLNENDYQINQNESDIPLGYITLNISKNEIPSIQDFIQEIQQ
ncbi:MAG: hypothetical protein EBZ49_16040 [Proteobacteria bacterium]|nr:hypothetical protein [Pseudomonadota bacterium]